MGDADVPAAERQVTAPHMMAVGGEDWSASNIADPERTAWRAELAALGGRSPLVHFDDDPSCRIELSATHPGGLARFITGSPTLLSQLIRDDQALRGARVAADRIAAKAQELATTRGLDAIQLGIGIVRWRYGVEWFRAPILLRPLAIRRHGRDFELKLRGTTALNPAFARVFAEQHGIDLDPRAFVALTEEDGAFKPNAVIDQLRALTGHLDDIEVQPRLVVSSFAEVAPALVADAADLEHPVLDALAGNSTARWAIEEAHREVAPMDPDHREPSTDLLLLDADAQQEQVIAQIAAGNSIVVTTTPGSGGTQTAVNAIGALVSREKRVLVVSSRRATLREISERFTAVGLPGVAVASPTLRRDLVRSIARNEKAAAPQMGEVDDALVRLRSVLLDYRTALAERDPALGVSVLDCVEELSRLALLPDPPTTVARLARPTIERLREGRGAVAETMLEAARLGEFRYGPADSPWYGASFDSADAAHRAHATAKHLHAESLPLLLERGAALIGQTRMRPFQSVAELGIHLRLLVDIRDTLDRFTPAVFDRSVSELITATASKRDHPEMPATVRRRLRKLAREYVRPGMHVPDLHAALTAVQQQRILWQRFVAAGVSPEVPVGLAEVAALWQQAAGELASLDAPLGRLSRENRLAAMPIPALVELVAGLAAESDVLENLQERSGILGRLRELELDGLISDLASRHVPEARIPAELEQSWWRSVLDELLTAHRALLGAKTEVLDRLEADFRLVDEAHAAGSAQQLGWRLAENWRIGLVDWPEEADALKRLLRRGDVDARGLHEAAPHLARSIAPVWLSSPYRIGEVSDLTAFDAVVLLDAGATTLAENVGAIRRAKQVVAFGDPVTQTPTPFQLAVLSPEREEALHAQESGEDAAERLESWHERSAHARLSKLLPTLELTRSYRAGGEDLAELVNRRFYGGRIDSLPWAGTFLGHGSLVLEYVEDGTGMPDPDSGTVESVDGEVARVVELVRTHAHSRPRESLMVVTASEKHAVRVLQAVLDGMAGDPELSEFVLADRAEPFTVATIERAAAQSRDRVVFSLGYGRTPHGRVLSDFGPLGRPGGERLLAVAMTRARRSLGIVTCFRPSDLDESRMTHGAIALAGILDEIEARRAEAPLPDDSDPMLVDLARRLTARGLRTALGHRGKLGLVAAHGGTCVVVETDSVLLGRSLREAVRLRPEVLRRLGWHYARVHAFELFRDPDAVADRIASLAGVERVAPVTEEIPVVSGAALA
ncbi:MAG: hypothetical protein J0G30_00605 [Actinomycetales bacterium]|nr:hypothetical protein [Actinomycetales bacterium]